MVRGGIAFIFSVPCASPARHLLVILTAHRLSCWNLEYYKTCWSYLCNHVDLMLELVKDTAMHSYQ